MTWHPDHPGGRIRCDHLGCTATRRHYCPPAERDEWRAVPDGTSVRDYCPRHRKDAP